jgi:leucyl-tRNA synthetase
MILAYSHRDKNGKYYHPSEIDEKDGGAFAKKSGEKLDSQIEKMSKSKQNVVSPDEVIDQYGADAMRLYEMFMGPLEQVKPWQMKGVEGVYRFLERAWRLIVDEETGKLSARLTQAAADSEPELNKALHKTIKKVLQDTEELRFNTGISQMMIFVNEAYSHKTLPRAMAVDFVRVLAPYAPHMAEELWERLGEKGLVSLASWPQHDEKLCIDATVGIAIQVNGKVRDEIQVPRDADKATLEKLALASEKAQKFMEGKPPKKVIVVPGRLVNIVC